MFKVHAKRCSDIVSKTTDRCASSRTIIHANWRSTWCQTDAIPTTGYRYRPRSVRGLLYDFFAIFQKRDFTFLHDV